MIIKEITLTLLHADYLDQVCYRVKKLRGCVVFIATITHVQNDYVPNSKCLDFFFLK